MVDISRKELPEWGAGAFEDPRLEVFYEDAKVRVLSAQCIRKRPDRNMIRAAPCASSLILAVFVNYCIRIKSIHTSVSKTESIFT